MNKPLQSVHVIDRDWFGYEAIPPTLAQSDVMTQRMSNFLQWGLYTRLYWWWHHPYVKQYEEQLVGVHVEMFHFDLWPAGYCYPHWGCTIPVTLQKFPGFSKILVGRFPESGGNKQESGMPQPGFLENQGICNPNCTCFFLTNTTACQFHSVSHT